MVLWISLAVLLLGVILLVMSNKTYKYDDFCYVFGGILIVLGAVCTILLASIAGLNHMCVEGGIACNQERYEILTEQWEKAVYENDNDIGKRELIKDIQNWNEEVAYKQVVQDDFWLGVFYPNIYDQFELIDLYDTAEFEE